MTDRAERDATSIGGRLRIERERLGLSQPAMAALAGLTKGALANWESSHAYPNANALACFAEAGANILFIITGKRVAEPSRQWSDIAGMTWRQMFESLDRTDRRRLLLELLAGELDG